MGKLYYLWYDKVCLVETFVPLCRCDELKERQCGGGFSFCLAMRYGLFYVMVRMLNIHRAKNRWAAARAEWQRKMNIAENEIKEVIENLKTENTHFDNLQHTMQIKKTEKTHLDVEEKSLRRQLSKYLLKLLLLPIVI